mmetsp:Transcript_6599/g.14484  ORF Transcript_6599/g.14484 Transcript_6599/m.14484 type:complete len:236 (-) Transcript_6599:2270-2977(-)
MNGFCWRKCIRTPFNIRSLDLLYLAFPAGLLVLLRSRSVSCLINRAFPIVTFVHGIEPHTLQEFILMLILLSPSFLTLFLLAQFYSRHFSIDFLLDRDKESFNNKSGVLLLFSPAAVSPTTLYLTGCNFHPSASRRSVNSEYGVPLFLRSFLNNVGTRTRLNHGSTIMLKCKPIPFLVSSNKSLGLYNTMSQKHKGRILPVPTPRLLKDDGSITLRRSTVACTNGVASPCSLQSS